jgi:heme oxygenase (mycobilin-producing)
MKIYLTSGTFDFLQKIKEKHPSETMILMQNNETSVLLHETPKKTVFGAPRSYQVLKSLGNLVQAGFASMKHIPVSDEERPVFEHRFKNKESIFQVLSGFIALRVLRPTKSNTYIIFTLWNNEKSYKEWEDSKAHENLFNNLASESLQAQMFMGKSYVSSYYLPHEEKDE